MSLKHPHLREVVRAGGMMLPNVGMMVVDEGAALMWEREEAKEVGSMGYSRQPLAEGWMETPHPNGVDAEVFDEVHYWTEVKLDIVREYASAYSKILAAQTSPSLCHVYIDAFAGAGMHVSNRLYSRAGADGPVAVTRSALSCFHLPP
jgi:hypothetical protein